MNEFDPHLRIAGSDGMDFYSISKYDKDPRRVKEFHLQDEIDIWQASQRAWADAAPNAEPYFLVGNHEDRLRRYLWKHPELSSLRALTLESVLELEELGITYRGERESQEIQIYNLVIKHGSLVRKHSAYTARGELENEFYSTNVLTGHTHRGGTTFARTRQGVVQATECFCLCDMEPSYITRPNWQQGIVLATATPEIISIEPIPFHRIGDELKAIWREKEFAIPVPE